MRLEALETSLEICSSFFFPVTNGATGRSHREEEEGLDEDVKVSEV